MNKVILAIALMLGSVACDVPWNGLPGLELRPSTQVAGTKDWWYAEVDEAATKWNAALEAEGCERPFRVVTEGGHPVVLVREDNWIWGADVNGKEVHNLRLDILNTPGEPAWPQNVLLHEMGHVMGLGHVDDETSVMYGVPHLEELSMEDVLAAACP